MDLVLKHKKITEPIINIIKRLRKETGNYYFDIIKEDLDNLTVTCPFHKNGKERKPACQIYCNYNGDILPGLTHCFACGKTVTLPQLVNYCFHNDEDDEFGTDWLISNYATVYYEYQVDIAPLNKITKNNTYISDSVLEKYKQYHPYMWQRKLTKDVVDCFEVGYDPQYNVITFPVRDEKGRLLGITARSVINKFYHIPPELTKPVYLLYYILQHNITNVVVVESQINALTLWSYNIPAVALFGTGTPEQLDILMKCGITYYLLAFDGDDAGRKGALRFINAFKQRPDIIIDVLILPQGKDVNDLSKEELDTLPSMDSVSYERFINK